ncbi:unnamed protein product [Closterium sp. NIES-64]|nr:unnamed protein product [Closterium sp. NIES-64]
MTGSPPASVPTWIVEVTRHRDLSQEALGAGFGAHGRARRDAPPRAHVMSEVPTSPRQELVDILMKPLLATATASRVRPRSRPQLHPPHASGHSPPQLTVIAMLIRLLSVTSDLSSSSAARSKTVPPLRSSPSPGSFSSTPSFPRVPFLVSAAFFLPARAVRGAWQVACGTAVELNDRRAIGLCLAARRANAERVYIGVKRCGMADLQGVAGLAGFTGSCWGGHRRAWWRRVRPSLPRACTLVVSQGGRGHKHQQLIGAQRTDLSRAAVPSSCSSTPRPPPTTPSPPASRPPHSPPPPPSALKPPAFASPLHVRRPSDPPPLEASASPLGSSGAPSSEFSISSSSSGPHSRSLPLAAPAPAPPAAAAGGEAAEEGSMGTNDGPGERGGAEARGGGRGKGEAIALIVFDAGGAAADGGARIEASGAQPMSSAATPSFPPALLRPECPPGTGVGGEAALRGAGRGAGMGPSLSASCSPSATPGGMAMGAGGEEGQWGAGHAVRKRSAERVVLPEGIPEEGEGGGAAGRGDWDGGGEEEGEWEGGGGGGGGRSLLADELAMLEAEDEGGEGGEEGGGGGEGSGVGGQGREQQPRGGRQCCGRQQRRGGRRQRGEVGGVQGLSTWAVSHPLRPSPLVHGAMCTPMALHQPGPALSPAPCSPLAGSSSFRGSALSPGGSSAGGSRQGSRQGSMQGSIEGVAGGGVGAMSGGGSVGAGDSSGTGGLLSRPAPTSSSSSSSRASRFHHLSAPSNTSPPAAAQQWATALDCRQFTAQQLARATKNYAQENLLGKGSFGAVFRGEMLGCQVAVKRLEGQGWQGPDEFRVEVEVLSRMRHPHIVLLMGCCTEEMALVYEFLPGGTLQDKLGPPKTADAVRLSWSDRLRICGEMATALMYLHRNDPPIVHRDLKPDNILLDGNLASKIGDVGLARLLEADGSTTMKVRGTLGYIDPEEVETCEISVLSDVYALGLIMLQLLTGQRAVKAVHRMLAECAKHAKTAQGSQPGPGGAAVGAVGVVSKYLESTGGEWRMDLAEEAAGLALRCADRRRGEPAEPQERGAAGAGADRCGSGGGGQGTQEAQRLAEVMRDPVVAGDGFTYEREHITRWMASCTLSPSTGQPLPPHLPHPQQRPQNAHLLPQHALISSPLGCTLASHSLYIQ